MEVDNIESSSRSKRTKVDKTGRFAALEKLKKLKGSKHKYEVTEEAPVYEELDEREFSRLVQQRQEDDWIIDDDGAGYVEDGREIFDDDDIEADAYTKKAKSQPAKKKYEPPQSRKVAKVSDIKSMFKAQPAKRKVEDVKLDDDELLGSIMEDIHNEDSDFLSTPKPMVLKKKCKVAHTSKQRFSNPFSVRQVSPLSVNVRSSRNSYFNDSSVPKEVARNHIRPKVVNFDRDIEIEETPEFLQPEDTPVNGESCEKEDTNEVIRDEQLVPENMDFDSFSADLFDDEEEDKPTQDRKELDFEADSELMKEFDEDNPTFSQESVPKKTPKPQKPSPPEKPALPETSFVGSVNAVRDLPNVAIPDVFVDANKLPLTTLASGEQVLRFYWIDAFEDPYKQAGVVYLFGKVFVKASNAYVSCCVIVKNIPRRVYVLPRETHYNMNTKSYSETPVKMQDVYSEFSSIAEKMKITEFKTKKSNKNYAFDNGEIPYQCEYLEVQYSAKFPVLPANLSGSTFSHVLGIDSSSLEMLLMDQKLKGPGWLDIHHPQVSSPPVSWCKLEAVAAKMQHVVPVKDIGPPPPVVVLAIGLATVVNSSVQQNEIIAVSCLTHHQFSMEKAAPSPPYEAHFCALAKPSNCIFPYDFKDQLSRYKHTKVERLDSERALLAFLLAKIHKIDPDVIVGHDIVGFDLDVLLHRIITNKVPHWSKIGRLKRSGNPRLNNGTNIGTSERNPTCGRIVCDVKISAQELIRCKSYDLVTLASQVLQQKHVEVPPENIRGFYNSSRQLLQLVDYQMTSVDLILRLACELNILPLALQITNIAGCVMSRTLLGGRSERNEYLLLHAFHEKNFISPPKYSGKKANKSTNEDMEDQENISDRKRGRRKPAYAGGLVLEPRKGFYDKYILLMDFNSLYPSIIQEYNICFTTVERVSNKDDKNEEDEPQVKLPDPGSDPGVLPTEIRKLVESRKQVKQMMKASDLPADRRIQYDIRQRALKLTANSMYGCLGFSHSRFYAKPLAAVITQKGREILMKTKELCEKMGLDVIYGDTDSIMINTNINDLNEVMKLGTQVKLEINKLYRLLEIDIDGVYKPMLLLKKKKYAALAITRLPNGQIVSKEEMKGLDIVRRDWSELAKDAGEYAIKEILSNKSKEDILENIHSHLMILGEEVTAGKRPVSDFIIIKQLTKNPEDYPDKKNLPHVQVALRMNSKGGRKLKQNDTVPYIVCEDGSNLPATQRAYHPDELKSNDKLKIDVTYYLAQQVHPVVSRLCNPIEGTDAATIAKFLGLNPEKYASAVRDHEQEDKFFNTSSVFDDEDRFKDCDKPIFRCPSEQCNQEITVDQTYLTEPSKWTTCQNSACNTRLYDHVPSLCNQLQKISRDYIAKYYRHVLICEDSGCAHRTRKMPLIFTRGGPLCPACSKSNLHPEFTESQLYLQLAFFSHLFDLKKTQSQVSGEEKVKVQISEEVEFLCRHLKQTVDKILQVSSYGVINLGNLFQGLFVPA